MRQESPKGDDDWTPLQFSIRTMLGLVAGLSVFFVMLGNLGEDAFLVVLLLLGGVLIWQIVRLIRLGEFRRDPGPRPIRFSMRQLLLLMTGLCFLLSMFVSQLARSLLLALLAIFGGSVAFATMSGGNSRALRFWLGTAGAWVGFFFLAAVLLYPESPFLRFELVLVTGVLAVLFGIMAILVVPLEGPTPPSEEPCRAPGVGEPDPQTQTMPPRDRDCAHERGRR